MSLRRLGVDTIDLFQLHRIDDKFPLEDQIGELVALQQEGKIRHIGLSEVDVDQLAAAAQITPIVSVQNMYNLTARTAEPVLDVCETDGIAFIPWFPLAAGPLAAADGPLQRIAADHDATAVAAGAGLAAQALAGDAADPRHVQGRAPGGERRRGRDRADRRRVRDAEQSRRQPTV